MMSHYMPLVLVEAFGHWMREYGIEHEALMTSNNIASALEKFYTDTIDRSSSEAQRAMAAAMLSCTDTRFESARQTHKDRHD